MNEWFNVFCYIGGFVQGMVLAYIIWAPNTRFKSAFMDGASLFLRRLKKD